jgi:hypothetical protein
MPPIKRKSEVWKYFSKTSDGFAECRFCNKKLKTSGNTSNLICHIARVHKNHTRTWTHTREEQNDVGQESDADDTRSTASSASTARIISNSTTSAGTSQTLTDFRNRLKGDGVKKKYFFTFPRNQRLALDI